MSWHIYSLTDPRDGRVRYVGKTCFLKRRLCNHVSEALRGRKHNHRLNWIRSLVESGQLPTLSVLESGTGDWQAAEQKWIKNFRAAGLDLVNATDGGEGTEGRVRSVETRTRQANAIKATLASPEARAKMSAASRAMWQSPEYRVKISAARKAMWQSPEARIRRSAAIKLALASPEARARRSVSMKAVWAKRKETAA